jgi:hypothetical protein
MTLGYATLGRTPLDEWSARPRDVYLTTHNSHERQTSMPPARFELGIPASKWVQPHVLDGAATGIGIRITQALNASPDTDIIRSTLVRTVRHCHVDEDGNSKLVLHNLSWDENKLQLTSSYCRHYWLVIREDHINVAIAGVVVVVGNRSFCEYQLKRFVQYGASFLVSTASILQPLTQSIVLYL